MDTLSFFGGLRVIKENSDMVAAQVSGTLKIHAEENRPKLSFIFVGEGNSRPLVGVQARGTY